MKKIAALCPMAVFAISLLSAQDSSIAGESEKLTANMTGQGFTCRVEKTGKASEQFELKLTMNKNILYYLAIVTGHGETIVHPSAVTLINQNKKVIPLEIQNREFGSAVLLHPLTDGTKTIKVRMQRKTDYSVTVCTNKASLYHSEQKNSPLDDHSHF